MTDDNALKLLKLAREYIKDYCGPGSASADGLTVADLIADLESST